jgi:hypothetical protein
MHFSDKNVSEQWDGIAAREPKSAARRQKIMKVQFRREKAQRAWHSNRAERKSEREREKDQDLIRHSSSLPMAR